MLHPFNNLITQIPLPERFTYPFHYIPHPLCEIAAKEVQGYLDTQEEWKEELDKGKMFGVLVVQTPTNEIGFLAAFSGILAGKNFHPYFVPPIYDLLKPNGFFKAEETLISTINKQIEELENNSTYISYQKRLTELTSQVQQDLARIKSEMKTAKAIREKRRTNNPSKQELEEMIRESQFQKAELKRTEQHWKGQTDVLQHEIDTFINRIESLKRERKERSAALQQKLFEQFGMLNAQGETRNLCEIFSRTAQKTPPAGAGECTAPKLLQYAYQNQLKPIAMAEFWWGNSPKGEIRHHGYFYPACKGKCGPILEHMLQGLNVENNPLLNGLDSQMKIEFIYEDEWLAVVNKPAGMLSVPGKTNAESVYHLLKLRYPDATGPMIVHRLDMATSGLLLIAKTKEVHQHLQAQFKNRTIKKRYYALLDGIVPTNEDIINLPICLNPLDRPRQMVNEEHGKRAITRYKVIERTPTQTRIIFYPLTGRTHQLRVHASHFLGLNCPITGDELYGKRAERLYLHAECLEFRHPISGEIIQVEKKAEF